MLIISDLHIPREHPKALEFCLRLRDKYKTDMTVCLGDLCDLASFSLKFFPNPNLPSPSDEIEFCKERLLAWYDNFPELFLIESNHDSRILKKAIGVGLPSIVLKSWLEILGAPAGWVFKEIGMEVDGVLLHHGEGLNTSSWKSSYNKLKISNIHGHLHSNAGVVFSESRKQRMFAGNFGCLIDPAHEAFNYARFVHERACIGTGVLLDGEVPIWEPLLL